MKRIWRVMSAFMRVQIGIMFQYRGEILLWAIWGLVNPIVLCAVWSAAAEGQPNKSIGGFTAPQLGAYYFAIMLLGHFSTAWDAYEMGYLIRSGSMSSQLLKPVLPIWQALAGNLAYKIVTLPFLIPMWLIFVWWMRPEFSAGFALTFLGIIAAILACLMSFILGYLIALVAFWSPKLDAAGEVYFGLGMFLGGRAWPMTAMWPPMIPIAKVLPFRWMFAFPAELAVGKIPSIQMALEGLVIQSLWILAIVVAFKLTWNQAIRKYTAVGG